MEKLMQRAEKYKEQSLINFQEMSVGKDTIPVASCSEKGNPHVLCRCDEKQVYDNKSNVVPTEHYLYGTPAQTTEDYIRLEAANTEDYTYISKV